MKKKIKRQSGFTLIEVSISVIIVSVIFIGMLNLLRSSFATSQKGMAHLANMETAVIVMSNLEYDLMRARNIEDCNDGFELRSIDVEQNEKQESWINYKIDNNKGIIYRNMSLPKYVSTRLGKDVKTFITYNFIKTTNARLKYGIDITITAYNKDKEKDKDKEAFTLRRFIMCRSMTSPLVKDMLTGEDNDAGIGGRVHPGILE